MRPPAPNEALNSEEWRGRALVLRGVLIMNFAFVAGFGLIADGLGQSWGPTPLGLIAAGALAVLSLTGWLGKTEEQVCVTIGLLCLALVAAAEWGTYLPALVVVALAAMYESRAMLALATAGAVVIIAGPLGVSADAAGREVLNILTVLQVSVASVAVWYFSRRSRRLTREALVRAQVAESRMQALSAYLPGLNIYLVGHDHRILDVAGPLLRRPDISPRMFFHDDGIGRDITDVLPERDHRTFDQMIERALDGEEDSVRTEGWSEMGAADRMFDVRVAPVLEDGQVVAAMMASIDITDRVSAERERQEHQRRAEQAEKAARREHEIAEILQTSMLPAALPDVPGVQLAARYRPAHADTAIGGDWYDAIELTNGRVGLAMGDVVGHGVEAAAHMGQLAAALRAYAAESDSPGDVLARLNRVAYATGRWMATVCYMIIDPAQRTVIAASAGHPPPQVIGRDGGDCRDLGEGFALPLGSRADLHVPTWRADLSDGDTIVLYTDGLVESREMPLTDGLARLRATISAGSDSIESLSDRLVDLACDADDVTLMVARVEPLSGETIDVTLEAVPSSLAKLRVGLRQWLASHGTSTGTVQEIATAVGEAATNAVEHAYAAEHATFRVCGSHHDGTVTLQVIDTGTWRAPRGEHRGMGTTIMHSFMDHVDVNSSPEGTTVTLKKHIR